MGHANCLTLHLLLYTLLHNWFLIPRMQYLCCTACFPPFQYNLRIKLSIPLP